MVFSFSPSSKAESHPTMWPELSIFWPPTGGCGLTRMPGGPGATVEAIVRSGVGDEKIPLVSGGTTAEPHGRDRWLGGATRRATSTSMLLVGVHLKTGNFENFWEHL